MKFQLKLLLYIGTILALRAHLTSKTPVYDTPSNKV